MEIEYCFSKIPRETIEKYETLKQLNKFYGLVMFLNYDQENNTLILKEENIEQICKDVGFNPNFLTDKFDEFSQRRFLKQYNQTLESSIKFSSRIKKNYTTKRILTKDSGNVWRISIRDIC